MRYLTFEKIRTIDPIIDEKKISRKKAAFLSVGITFLVILFVSLNYEPLLGPDDVGIRNILSGIYTGTPEAHTYFMDYMLTKPLSMLYEWFPNVYWYVLFLALVNYGCLILILYRFLCKVDRYKLIGIWSVVAGFLILWLPFIITLEWTSAAGILSATAIFWYATTPDRENRKELLRDYIFSLILLFVACNLRNDVAFMAIPFAGVVFLWKLVQNRKFLSAVFLRTQLLFAMMCVAIFVVSKVSDSLAYSSDVWKEADRFSEYRSTMYDRFGWPDYDIYKDIYTKNNISLEMYHSIKNDYNLMLCYKGVLSSNNFEELSEVAEESFYSRNDTKSRLKNCLRRRWEAMGSQIYGLHTVMIYIGLICSLVCSWCKKDRLKLFLVVNTAIGFELVWIYLYFRNRLPIHVGYSLNMIAIAVVIAFLWKEPLIKKVLKSGMVWLIICLFLSSNLLQKAVIIKEENHVEATNALLLSTVKKYCEENKENIYFRDFFSFNNSILYKELIYARDERKAANFVPPNGWSVILPMDNQYIPSGGEQELCSWIQEKSNIYIMIERSRVKNTRMRTEALFASRGIDCHLVLEDVLEIPNGLIIEVYHFQS